MEGVIPTEAERHLVWVYGYHVHRNNGRHMDRDIKGEEFWQAQWWIFLSQSGSWYRAPVGEGGVDQRFIKCPAEELYGVRE